MAAEAAEVDVTIAFRESLPPSCPPADAHLTKRGQVVYRIIGAPAPTLYDDFRSNRLIKPNYKNRDPIIECQFCGLSVRATHTDATKAILLPLLKAKYPNPHICTIQLSDAAGRIMQTGTDPGHMTWWPSSDYDILAHCAVAP